MDITNILRYLLFINALAFIIYGIDKLKARKGFLYATKSIVYLGNTERKRAILLVQTK